MKVTGGLYLPPSARLLGSLVKTRSQRVTSEKVLDFRLASAPVVILFGTLLADGMTHGNASGSIFDASDRCS